MGNLGFNIPYAEERGPKDNWLYTIEIEIQVPRLKKKERGKKIAATTSSILEDNHAMQYRLRSV